MVVRRLVSSRRRKRVTIVRNAGDTLARNLYIFLGAVLAALIFYLVI